LDRPALAIGFGVQGPAEEGDAFAHADQVHAGAVGEFCPRADGGTAATVSVVRS
jgi:hypothetical protein